MFKFVPLAAAAGVVALASGIYPSASAATPRVTPRIGLVSMGSPGFTSSFDYVPVSHPTR